MSALCRHVRRPWDPCPRTRQLSVDKTLDYMEHEPFLHPERAYDQIYAFRRVQSTYHIELPE